MTILVTGAPGWLGSEIVSRLDTYSKNVRCLVYEGVSADSLTEYDVEIVYGDITDQSSLSNVFNSDIDIVYHCAGVNHPSRLNGVSKIHEINAEGTRNLLEAGRKHGVTRFVYISSIMAHGFNQKPERDWTPDMELSPDTEYGRSKLKAEQYIRHYQQEYGINYTIVRPCWYYGPRQPPRMATLLNSIKQGRPIMFGDGTNRRSMMYVPSLVDLLLSIPENLAASKNEAYDVADQHTYTTNEIYETMADCLDVGTIRPRRFHEPFPTLLGLGQRTLERFGIHIREFHVGWEMSQHISCDPTKAMNELNWEPPERLLPGMETAIEWAQQHDQI